MFLKRFRKEPILNFLIMISLGYREKPKILSWFASYELNESFQNISDLFELKNRPENKIQTLTMEDQCRAARVHQLLITRSANRIEQTNFQFLSLQMFTACKMGQWRLISSD